MNDYQYIPITHHTPRSATRFRVEVALDGDGWWHAWIAYLPGCVSWGYSKEEALQRVRDMAHVYLDALRAKGFHVPFNDEIFDEPMVTVTV